MVQHKLHGEDLDMLELVQLTCTLCCVTTIKLIKDRKHLLLFPQFIKYRTIELLWNLDITWGLVQDLKENFERGFRMDIVLEVSEIEDYSEFPNIEIQTVEITSKNKQATQHRKGTSLASKVSTSDKATQTISRRVWRKIKRKAHLKQQDAYQTTIRSSSSSYTQRTSRICTEDERICKASRRTNQQGKNQNAFRSSERKRSIETEKDLKDAQEELKTKVDSFSTQEAEMKIKEDKLKAIEDLLEMNQKDLEKEKEDLLKEQDQLAAKDVDLSQRETNIKAAEKSNKVKEEHFKSQAKKLTEREEELKVEEARLEVLKKEVPDVTPGKGMEATILLQQKQLLEKCLSQNENTERLIARQMKLEEDREARERKRDKKEEEALQQEKVLNLLHSKEILERDQKHIF